MHDGTESSPAGRTSNQPPLKLTTFSGAQPRVALLGGTTADRMVATVLTRHFGCQALDASGDDAGLSLLRGTQAADLILIDLNTPASEVHTREPLLQALNQPSPIPVVGLADPALLARAAGRLTQKRTLLPKPYSPRELFDVMAAAMLGKVMVHDTA